MVRAEKIEQRQTSIRVPRIEMFIIINILNNLKAAVASPRREECLGSKNCLFFLVKILIFFYSTMHLFNLHYFYRYSLIFPPTIVLPAYPTVFSHSGKIYTNML